MEDKIFQLLEKMYSEFRTAKRTQVRARQTYGWAEKA